MQGPGIGAHRGAHSERGIDGGAHGGALPDDGLLVRLHDGGLDRGAARTERHGEIVADGCRRTRRHRLVERQRYTACRPKRGVPEISPPKRRAAGSRHIEAVPTFRPNRSLCDAKIRSFMQKKDSADGKRRKKTNFDYKSTNSQPAVARDQNDISY